MHSATPRLHETTTVHRQTGCHRVTPDCTRFGKYIKSPQPGPSQDTGSQRSWMTTGTLPPCRLMTICWNVPDQGAGTFRHSAGDASKTYQTRTTGVTFSGQPGPTVAIPYLLLLRRPGFGVVIRTLYVHMYSKMEVKIHTVTTGMYQTVPICNQTRRLPTEGSTH